MANAIERKGRTKYLKIEPRFGFSASFASSGGFSYSVPSVTFVSLSDIP